MRGQRMRTLQGAFACAPFELSNLEFVGGGANASLVCPVDPLHTLHMSLQ